MPEEKDKKTKSKKTTESKETKTEDTTRSTPHLYRSETDKIIAGVASGIGTYFTIDPVFVRLIFILLTIFHGSGVLIYLILWIILPKESTVPHHASLAHETVRNNLREVRDHLRAIAKNAGLNQQNNSKIIIAVIVILLGVMLLLDNLGLSDWFDLGRFWPLILIVVGLAILF